MQNSEIVRGTVSKKARKYIYGIMESGSHNGETVKILINDQCENLEFGDSFLLEVESEMEARAKGEPHFKYYIPLRVPEIKAEDESALLSKADTENSSADLSSKEPEPLKASTEAETESKGKAPAKKKKASVKSSRETKTGKKSAKEKANEKAASEKEKADYNKIDIEEKTSVQKPEDIKLEPETEQKTETDAESVSKPSKISAEKPKSRKKTSAKTPDTEKTGNTRKKGTANSARKKGETETVKTKPDTASEKPAGEPEDRSNSGKSESGIQKESKTGLSIKEAEQQARKNGKPATEEFLSDLQNKTSLETPKEKNQNSQNQSRVLEKTSSQETDLQSAVPEKPAALPGQAQENPQPAANIHQEEIDRLADEFREHLKRGYVAKKIMRRLRELGADEVIEQLKPQARKLEMNRKQQNIEQIRSFALTYAGRLSGREYIEELRELGEYKEADALEKIHLQKVAELLGKA